MDRPRIPRTTEARVVAAATTVGLGALVGLAAYGLTRPARATQPGHKADDAPGLAAKKGSFGGYAVAGRTVTINKPRGEIYAFVRDFANLPRYMANIDAVEDAGGTQTWTIRAPLGRTVTIVTRIVNEHEGESFAWTSTDESQVEGQGKFILRDAPGGRGTMVESVVAYKPPGGEVGRLAAKLFQAEPSVQTRRDLKRLKMLLETGEIATNSNQKDAA